jgi:hypothetical protein
MRVVQSGAWEKWVEHLEDSREQNAARVIRHHAMVNGMKRKRDVWDSWRIIVKFVPVRSNMRNGTNSNPNASNVWTTNLPIPLHVVLCCNWAFLALV